MLIFFILLSFIIIFIIIITSTLAPNAWGIKACDFRPVTRHILQKVCLLLLSIYLSWKINDRNSDRTFSFVSLFLLSKCPLHTSFEGQSHFVSHEPPNILMDLPTHAVSAEFPNVTAYSGFMRWRNCTYTDDVSTNACIANSNTISYMLC